jgi:hypothetical protein
VIQRLWALLHVGFFVFGQRPVLNEEFMLAIASTVFYKEL